MPVYKIVYKQEALDDLRKAFDFYDVISYSLGDKFYHSFKGAIHLIEKSPYHYSYINNSQSTIYRKIVLKNFPYSIIYEIINAEIIVYSIHHFAKHPSKRIRKNLK